MDLEKIKITDIKPADYNPRMINDNEFSKLQNSISEFGVVDPIIINLKNNHIIGGHQRYDVLLDKYMSEGSFLEELHLLRLGDVGWVFPDTDLEIKSDDHEKALNLALNKISGEWDETKLAPLLEEFSISGFNVELTGFDKEDIELLTLSDGDFDDLFDLEDYDDEDETPDDMVSVEGEVQNKNYTIMLVFKEKDTAEGFLKFLNCDKKLMKESIVLNEEEISYENTQ